MPLLLLWPVISACATCFLYLHVRSIPASGQEQRETEVLFGVMFSLLGGRNRVILK
jgi:hypothetical protein